MKYLIVFLAGAAAGALAALLLAPKSGDELRSQIHDEAVRDQERIRQSYEAAAQKAHDSYERVQAKLPKDEVEATVEDVETAAEEIIEEAAAVVEENTPEAQ